MKKIIVKFWSVGLLLALLSTLFVGSAAPAAAADYAMSDSLLGPYPTAFAGPLADTTPFSVTGIAQSGATIYAIATNGASYYLYKSADGGMTWAAQTTGIPAGVTFSKIAVAPDNANNVAIVDTTSGGVYYSTFGGTLFAQLSTNATVTAAVGTVTSIAMSPNVLWTNIAVGGTGGVATWPGAVGPVSPSWTPAPGITKVAALKYSPNFPADASLLAVDVTAANATNIDVYSSNLLAWDPVGYGYPIPVSPTATSTVLTKATITLDPNFYLGDVSTQIGFIGIDGTSNNNTLYNGVYRFDTNSAGYANQIYSVGGVNSVAWDGTNLMVAPYVTAATDTPLVIWRSANALTSPSSVSFLQSSTYKAPGTGTNAIVNFNSSGVALCFSQGTNSAVAKSTDEGKDWDGIAMVNSNFNTVSNFWVSADSSRIYAAVYDGTDMNVWKFNAGVWSRVFILANAVGTNWEVRALGSTPDTVFVAQKGGTTMFKSTDGGETWVTRACAAPIQDFAIEDENTLYATTSLAGYLFISTNGGFTWTPYPTASALSSATGYSLTLVSPKNLILGTTGGYVEYTTDGGMTWAAIPAPINLSNTLTVATGLTAGSVIFASAPGTANAVQSWTVGSSIAWTPAAATANISGLSMQNGVVYAISNNGTGGNIYRWLYPTFGAQLGFTDTIPYAAIDIGQANDVNTLQASGTGSTTLWADNVATPDNLVAYSEYLPSPANAPALTYPVNGQEISVNSLSGNSYNFVFQWKTPALLPNTPLQDYTYNIFIYLDQAQTITMGSAFGISPFHYGGSIANEPASAIAGLSLIPGTTYYWTIMVATPVSSFMAPVQSFVVQQLQAVVPSLASPATGSTLAMGQTVAFAWSPITGTASYNFQLSVDPSFDTTVFTDTTTSAGEELPSNIHLIGGTTYFWRVQAATPTLGDWSSVGNFMVAKAVTTTSTTMAPPPVTIITTSTSIVIPQPVQTVITVPQVTPTTTEVNPSYIWAIIIIGFVLVIAVIVLIVRTRRSV